MKRFTIYLIEDNGLFKPYRVSSYQSKALLSRGITIHKTVRFGKKVKLWSNTSIDEDTLISDNVEI